MSTDELSSVFLMAFLSQSDCVPTSKGPLSSAAAVLLIFNRFQQNYVDISVHEPHSSNSWATDDAKIHFKMEPGYRGSARVSPEMEGFNISKVDLALATVPGLDFDPTKRSFSAEELKPQPIIKKRKKVKAERNLSTSIQSDKFLKAFLF